MPARKNRRSIRDIPQSMAYAAPVLTGKRKKIAQEDFCIPEQGDEGLIGELDFNVAQLKQICGHHNLKKSGNKEQLRNRCYSFLKINRAVSLSQARLRGGLRRKLNRLRGPGLFKREICTNTTDFLSFEETNQIPPDEFFSYTDSNGKIWAFDVLSISTHLEKNGNQATNPFTREPFPQGDMLSRFRDVNRLAKMLGVQTNLKFESAVQDPMDIEAYAREMFQLFDGFGLFTDHTWFLELQKHELLNMYKALHDIWTYRADLSQNAMMSIYSPSGRPFDGFSWSGLSSGSREHAQRELLRAAKRFSTAASDEHHQQLGVYYFLGSLTTVSPAAANALPWLYQSVA